MRAGPGLVALRERQLQRLAKALLLQAARQDMAVEDLHGACLGAVEALDGEQGLAGRQGDERAMRGRHPQKVCRPHAQGLVHGVPRTSFRRRLDDVRGRRAAAREIPVALRVFALVVEGELELLAGYAQTRAHGQAQPQDMRLGGKGLEICRAHPLEAPLAAGGSAGLAEHEGARARVVQAGEQGHVGLLGNLQRRGEHLTHDASGHERREEQPGLLGGKGARLQAQGRRYGVRVPAIDIAPVVGEDGVCASGAVLARVLRTVAASAAVCERGEASHELAGAVVVAVDAKICHQRSSPRIAPIQRGRL